MNNKITKNNGITLVALVVTIVILLILAGISISALTQTGIFGKAKETVGKYEKSASEEKIKLIKAEAMINDESITEYLTKQLTEDEKEKLEENGIVSIEKYEEISVISSYKGFNTLSKNTDNGDDYSGKTIILLNNIDFGATFNKSTGELIKGEAFEPIKNFKGTLDGEDKTIENLYINKENESDIGLFSTLSEDATVKNIKVNNLYVCGAYQVGGIVGHSYGTVDNCTVEDSVIIAKESTQDGSRIGGVVGYNSTYAKIINCTNKAEITGDDKLCGGICGFNIRYYRKLH